MNLGLARLGQRGISGLARLVQSLDSLEVSSYPVESVPGQSLPPIAPKQVEAYYASLNAESAPNQRYSSDEIVLALGVLSGVDFLFCVGWSDSPVAPKFLYETSDPQ